MSEGPTAALLQLRVAASDEEHELTEEQSKVLAEVAEFIRQAEFVKQQQAHIATYTRAK